jgi:hypothetical protein
MVEFIKKYYHLAIIISVVAWAGCASTDTSRSGESEKTSVNNSKPDNLENNSAAAAGDEKRQDVLNERKQKGEKLLTLTDGSQYIEMKDGYGNKIEYRYFERSAPVRYISLETLEDGTTTMFVKSSDGPKKRINPSLIENPWKSNAREIAARAGIFSNFKLNNNRSASGTTSSTGAATSVKPTNRIVKNNQPQELKPPAEPVSPDSNNSLKPE